MTFDKRFKELERRAAQGEPLFETFYEYIPPIRRPHTEYRVTDRWYDYPDDPNPYPVSVSSSVDGAPIGSSGFEQE